MANGEKSRRGADTVGWVNFKFSIKLSVVGAVLLLALTGCYWYVSTTKETLLFFLLGLTALGTVTASFYTARILVATLDKGDREVAADEKRLAAQEKHNELELKRASFRYAERWNDPRMFYARKTIRELADAHIGSEDEVKTYISDNQTNIIHVLNFLEEICSAQKHGIVDKDVTRAQFDYVIVSTWQIVAPWVIAYRKSRNDNIWDDLEAMAKQWKTG